MQTVIFFIKLYKSEYTVLLSLKDFLCGMVE